MTSEKPQTCDPEVFRYGTIIRAVRGVAVEKLNEWVEKISELSGEKVDWHTSANWQAIKAVKNHSHVEDVMAKHYRELAARESHKDYEPKGKCHWTTYWN